jgi:uncharacterized protein (UPF0276 family)
MSTMPEWEFLSRLTQDTSCHLLLDVNNIYVSSRNHDFDPLEYLANIPPDCVQQYHLAGHTDLQTHCIDTHDGRVVDAVWNLYRRAVARFGSAATLLEWDARIPSFAEVHAEALKAKHFLAEGSELPPPVSPIVPSHANPFAVPHPAHLITADSE